jgi:hypothetical protein
MIRRFRESGEDRPQAVQVGCDWIEGKSERGCDLATPGGISTVRRMMVTIGVFKVDKSVAFPR